MKNLLRRLFGEENIGCANLTNKHGLSVNDGISSCFQYDQTPHNGILGMLYDKITALEQRVELLEVKNTKKKTKGKRK